MIRLLPFGSRFFAVVALLVYAGTAASVAAFGQAATAQLAATPMPDPTNTSTVFEVKNNGDVSIAGTAN